MLNKKFFTILYLLLVSCSSFAVNGNINNSSRNLLEVLHWDQRYEVNRVKDLEYILGNIDGPSVQNLNDAQKKSLLITIRKTILDQMMKDKDTYKVYMIEQYNKSFTMDELESLIQYYNTPVMQLVINSQLKNKEITIDEINMELLKAKSKDQQIVEWFRNSYLNIRYQRFQEKVNPIVNKMIANRMETVIEATLIRLPELVTYLNNTK